MSFIFAKPYPCPTCKKPLAYVKTYPFNPEIKEGYCYDCNTTKYFGLNGKEIKP